MLTDKHVWLEDVLLKGLGLLVLISDGSMGAQTSCWCLCKGEEIPSYHPFVLGRRDSRDRVWLV